MEKNAFWKIIKKHKNRNRSFTKNKIKLCEFEKFYTNLFSHDDMEDKEEHVKINEEVNKYYSELKEKIFDVNISENLIEICLKKLKKNKAVGNDIICNEMYKNAKCEKLNRSLKEIFNVIINQGMVLNNFNISLISPIEKKSNGNKSPDDYRPISVSNSISNIYEMILLNLIHSIFKFNNKQFGYKVNTSCKHASFIINESISHYKKGGSPCFVVSLDM